jgi:hypothetical protein
VTASFAFVTLNGPDRQAQHLINSGNVTQPNVTQYGQR